MNAAVLQAREPSVRYLVELQPPLVRSFDLLATAPQGVAKLRELILSLGVRGRLVRQDPSDESAVALIRRIARESERPIPEMSEVGLPSGWVRVLFGDYADEVNTGPFGSLIGKDDYVDGGVPLVNPSHMRNGRINAEADVAVSEAKAAELRAYRLRADDIVFARRGEVGRTALVTSEEDGWLCGTGSFFARFHRDVDRAFVQMVFVSSAMRAYLSGAAVGATMVNLNQRVLRNAALDIPPLAEQARIVARVEELMKLCDALEERGRLEAEQHARLVSKLFDSLAASENTQALAENWQRITQHFDLLLDRPEAIDALEQTILQLAVRGLLVPQDPRDEPADALLTRIRAERDQLIAAGKMRRDKPLPPVSVAEQRLALPSGWIWVRMQHISDARLGKMLDKAKNTGQLCPYLRNTNVQWRRFELDDIKQIRLEPHELDEFRLLPGDLLICEEGEPGRCAIWRNESLEMYFQKALHRVRPLGGVLPEFLELCLQSDAAAGLLDQYFTGATIKHFAGQELSRYVLPLPPAKEQHRIVARVQQLRALCAQLRERLQRARRTQGLLADTLANTAVNA